MRADPWTKLRESLEQLDIKYTADYDQLTTHVVSKKRNTPKGLQALINGKYVVTDSFINAIVEAANVEDDVEEGVPSALESDFDGNWPNALEHLPPRGEEPVDRPNESYAPDPRRQDVFEGYTFVFYEKKQHENLFPVITHGKGKAVLEEVVPKESNIDDFIRSVKTLAGEKGLGSFEDGSEGKGVVLVRYVPAKGDDTEWYQQFVTAVALRLDHRPMDQREFLEAILACDASMLRRPLEMESQANSPNAAPQHQETSNRMEIDQPQPSRTEPSQAPAEQQESAPTRRLGRARRGAASRFKGFDLDDDYEESPPITQPPEESAPAAPAASQDQDSLFVSQRQDHNQNHMEEEDEPPGRATRKSQSRKRPLSPLPEHDNSAFLDEIAPTAAAAKRRRIASGQDPIPPEPEPEAGDQEDEEMVEDSPPPAKGAKGRGKKTGKGATESEDILELARKQREEQEARAAAERRALTHPAGSGDEEDEIDYAAIRRLHIIEECDVHFPAERQARNKDDNNPGGVRSRDHDVASGRWDPQWNGRKNFKRFRKQGEPVGRPLRKNIYALEEVKPKEYGIGDDYWLEGGDKETQRKDKVSMVSQSQAAPATQDAASMLPPPVPVSSTRRTVVAIDSSDEEDEEDDDVEVEDSYAKIPEPEPPRSRAAKAAEKTMATRRSQATSSSTASQSQPSRASTRITQTQSGVTSSTAASTRAGGKRPTSAAPPPQGERAAKKPRKVALRSAVQDSEEEEGDDSEDDLKFKFGRRK